MGERFPRTVVRCKELDAVLAKKTETHEVYYCPFCHDKEFKYGVLDPKPDTAGKLYMEIGKNQGFCHRCDTIVFSNWTLESSTIRLTDLLKEAIYDNVNPEDLPEISLNAFPYAYEIGEAVNYLIGRNSFFNRMNIKKLELRWFDRWIPIYDGIEKEWIKIRRVGIIIPLKFQGKIRSYQIRYITDDKKHRFHTMDGLRTISFVIDPPLLGSEISIGEGYFDAVALLCMGFPYPMAIFGSTPSKFQIKQIRTYAPSKINLCLDTLGLNSSLAKMLRKKVPTITRQKCWNFKGLDPEEYLNENKKFKYISWRR